MDSTLERWKALVLLQAELEDYILFTVAKLASFGIGFGVGYWYWSN